MRTFRPKQGQSLRPTTSSPSRSHAKERSASRSENLVADLQSRFGNQATLHWLGMRSRPREAATHAPISLASPAITQARLANHTPAYALEQEAHGASEHVASQPRRRIAPVGISRAPDSVQPKCSCGGTCSACRGHEEGQHLQRKAASSNSEALPTAAPMVRELLNSTSQPLDAETRAFMELRFGHDFGKVRVHTDHQAAGSALALGANAYTFGQHVFFRKGAFNPANEAGRRLIAHELAHTIQQRSGGPEPPGHEHAREGEANRAANQVLSRRAVAPLTQSGLALARDPASDASIDAQIFEIEQQLKAPVQPLRPMLEARLAQLQARRAQGSSGGGPAIPEPQACDVLGNAPHTPETIDQKLVEIELAKTKLWTAVNLPGPMTYEQAAPQLHALELQKIKLLECGITRGSRIKLRVAPTKQAADAAAQYARKSQEALNHVGEQLGKKQAERRKFWEADKHGRSEMAALDIKEETYRLPGFGRRTKTRSFRDPMIDAIEHELFENAEARRAYEKGYSDVMNEPEEESLFHKIVSGVICENIEPCKSNLEQYRADVAGGMSVNEARMRGLVRLAPMLIPSKTGPGDLVPIGGERPFVPPTVVHADPPVIPEPAVNVKPDPVVQQPPPVQQPKPPIHVDAPVTEPPVTSQPKASVTDVPNPPVKDPAKAPAVVKPSPAPAPASTVKSTPPPMKAPPGGGPRGTVTVTSGTIKSSKPAQPDVTVLPRSSRPFTPDYAVDPYVPPKNNVSGEYQFRQFEKGGKVYKQADGRLGMPNEVETHRNPGAQRKVSGGTGDDAGHLIGNRFGPPGGAENLGRQNWIANRIGNYHALEDAWAALRHRGVEIDVQVTDVTRVGEDRPFMRNVQWTETAPDGTQKSFEVDFANTTTPESRLKSGGASTSSGEGGTVIHVDFGKSGGN